ncbi:MAG: Stp1/IreP family PP2C-type Ser/Thr phosphatase [Candidatus Krumholzibacteria bacterium]|nr:Stp1/IreP family PP2C-type Ser/Thr phosphatase [Candidatus Krumholzibacteria bacterium]
MAWDFSALSDKGKVRKKNEDYYGIFEPETAELMSDRGILAIVSDGMGGHFSGGEASRMTVELLGEAYFKDEKTEPMKLLDDSFREANREVFYEVGEGRKGLAGTTCTAVVFFSDHINIAHAGDSRAYLVRDGSVEMLTHDHSVVGEMLSRGILDEEEARTHPRRNVITKAVGLREDVEPELIKGFEIKQGDMLVICSDGLTSMVPSGEILEIVTNNRPEKACELLVARANDAGGDDNITVVVALNS